MHRGIPSDAFIAEGHVRWIVDKDSYFYDFPPEKSERHELKTGEKGTATCRIREPDGTWWLALTLGEERGNRYIPSDSVSWKPIPSAN